LPFIMVLIFNYTLVLMIIPNYEDLMKNYCFWS